MSWGEKLKNEWVNKKVNEIYTYVCLVKINAEQQQIDEQFPLFWNLKKANDFLASIPKIEVEDSEGRNVQSYLVANSKIIPIPVPK